MSTLQKKVLVVDDDPIIGRSFSGVLSGKGYAVITAHNGEEALRKINAEKYDIVFTDIKMPGMNGVEVAERIRASQPWLPVVIITGFGSEESKKRAQAAGVSDFLDKPLSPEMIERSTREGIEKGASATNFGVEENAESGASEAREESIIVFPPNVKLFFTAPFVGLAHTITLPLEGIDMLASLGEQGLVKRGVPGAVAHFLKTVAFLSLAPLLELIYLALLPFAGISILAWMGAREVGKYFGLIIEKESTREPEGEAVSLGTLRDGGQKAVLRIESGSEKGVSPRVDKAPETVGGYLKNILVCFTAPFIGLVYIITFPFVGLGTLSVMGAREMVRLGVPERVAIHLKNVALFFMGPIVGLAYALALPFVGLGMLAWFGLKSLKKYVSK